MSSSMDVEDGEISSGEEIIAVPPAPRLKKNSAKSVVTKLRTSPPQGDGKRSKSSRTSATAASVAAVDPGVNRKPGRRLAAGGSDGKRRGAPERPSSPDRSRHHRRHQSPVARKSPDRNRGRKRALVDSPDNSAAEEKKDRGFPSGRRPKARATDDDEWGYKLNARPEKDGGTAGTPREDSAKVPCKFYSRGTCNRIQDCPFFHDGPVAKINELCRYHVKTGCKKRKFCLYMHEEFPCKYFHMSSSCYAGDGCRFSHQPLTEDTKALLDKWLEATAERSAEFRARNAEKVDVPEKTEIAELPKAPSQSNEVTPPRVAETVSQKRERPSDPREVGRQRKESSSVPPETRKPFVPGVSVAELAYEWMNDRDQRRTKRFKREATPEKVASGRPGSYYSADPALYPAPETAAPAEAPKETKESKDVDHRLRPPWHPWWQEQTTKDLRAMGIEDVDMRVRDTDMRDRRNLPGPTPPEANVPELINLADEDDDDDALKIDEGIEEDHSDDDPGGEEAPEPVASAGGAKRKLDEEGDAVEENPSKKQKLADETRRETPLHPIFSLPSNLASVSVFDQILASFQPPTAPETEEQANDGDQEKSSKEEVKILESPMSPDEENPCDLDDYMDSVEEKKKVAEEKPLVVEKKVSEVDSGRPKDPRLARFARQKPVEQQPMQQQQPQPQPPLPKAQQEPVVKPTDPRVRYMPQPPSNGGHQPMNGFQQHHTRPVMGFPSLPPGYRPMAPSGSWSNGDMGPSPGWNNRVNGHGHGQRLMAQPRGGLLPTPRMHHAGHGVPRFNNFRPIPPMLPPRGPPRPPHGGVFRPRGNEYDLYNRDRDHRQRHRDDDSDLFDFFDEDVSQETSKLRAHYRV